MPIFVNSSKIPQTGWTTEKFILSQFLLLGSPRSRFMQGLVSGESSLPPCRWPLSHYVPLPHMALLQCVHMDIEQVSSLLSCLTWTLILLDQGPIYMTSFNLNYLLTPECRFRLQYRNLGKGKIEQHIYSVHNNTKSRNLLFYGN